MASSRKAVYAALFGNLGIAIAKFLGALFTGSAAMMAEAYHSFSDTFNQILLLIGLGMSTKGVSDKHQFGRSKEQFFWSFMVATMLFGVSGILSFQRGLDSLLHEDHSIENASVSYVILAFSFLFEANALRIAYGIFRETISDRGETVSIRTLIKEFNESKDPTVLTVIVEDTAALSGILVAAIGIYLSELYGTTFYDSLATIVIGIILMLFAVFLARENKDLLVGEAMSREDEEKVLSSISAIQEVKKVVSMKSMHLGPEDVIIAVGVFLESGLDAERLASVVDEIEKKVIDAIPHASPGKTFVEVVREKP